MPRPGSLARRAAAPAGRVLATVRSSIGGWVRRAGLLPKWLVVGTVIGSAAGLGAIAFQEALSTATRLLTELSMGHSPPEPGLGGGGTRFSRPWAVPIVTCLGGLVAGLLVHRFAPEAEGPGTDAAIHTVHTDPRGISGRTVVVKILASAVTIGSGGSGGREGPTAQISAGFGSMLSRLLDLTPRDGRTAVAVGLGCGIGAIFGAPLGGAVTAAEVLYQRDFDPDVLIPGFIASVASFTVFGLAEGFTPLFGPANAGYRLERPVELVWFALVGTVCGFAAILYSTVFHHATALARRLPGPRVLKPAGGGLLTGLLALGVPETLGTGYGWVQRALERQSLLHMSLWLVLALPMAKILATALSIGSGGSGGVFGPWMVIGAFVGAAVWRVAEPLGLGAPYGPAPLVIVGMMACFGPVARTPLGMMLMVVEMTGGLTIIAPAMLAVGIACLITGRSGAVMYRSQLRDRTALSPHDTTR